MRIFKGLLKLSLNVLLYQWFIYMIYYPQFIETIKICIILTVEEAEHSEYFKEKVGAISYNLQEEFRHTFHLNIHFLRFPGSLPIG